MDLVPYLSAVILISTIATIVLAVLSYAAFKLRDKRRPKGSDTPVFFRVYGAPTSGDEGEKEAP